MQKFTLALLVLAFACPAKAGPIEFAPEFNFTSKIIREQWAQQSNRNYTWNDASRQTRDEWAQRIFKSCPECAQIWLNDKYGGEKIRITYPSGWYFEITLDPGVLEIGTKPTTLATFREHKALIERDIWNNAKSLGLFPARSSHMNIGVKSAFGQDTPLFRNFLVDYMNHIELPRGIHHSDLFNAPHVEDLGIMGDDPGDDNPHSLKLQKIFQDENPLDTPKDLARKIVRGVYTDSNFGSDVAPRHKYQSINLSSMVFKSGWPRVELRSMRMQKTFDDFLALAELFEKRIEFLKTIKKPLQYKAWRYRDRSTLNDEKLIARYYEYVKNAGLDWDLYSNLIPNEFNNALTQFESRLWKCRQTLAQQLKGQQP